jgi:hypothetical protein
MPSFFRATPLIAFVLATSFVFAQSPPSKSLRMPIVFQKNEGQFKGQYEFVVRGEFEAQFSSKRVIFNLPGIQDGSETVELTFVASNPHLKVSGLRPVQAEINYFVGSDASRYLRHIPNYGDIRYEQLYPGIDLDFYGNQGSLEHDFTIAPHANVAGIALHFDGAKRIEVGKDGDLLVHSSAGVLCLKRPIAYQMDGNRRRNVSATFQKRKDGDIGFQLGPYNPARPLTIDPVFVFSTFLHGSGTDTIQAVTTDPLGNIYVTGYTNSTDFPVTANADQSNCLIDSIGQCHDIFVTKLDPTGKDLIFSTYLGGLDAGDSSDIAVDLNGNVIVVGISGMGFPQSPSVSLPPSCQKPNSPCYFLASLKSDGSALNYSGLVGGIAGNSLRNEGRLAVDGSGNAYLAGATVDSGFQITGGTLSSTVPGYPYNVLFVLKADPTGKIVYSTIVPGNSPPDPASPNTNFFNPGDIAVDSSGQVTVTGTAGSGLPTTTGVVGSTYPVNQTSAGFVLQLNASASAINYATYIPGTDTSDGLGISSNGNVFVAGSTNEDNLPVSSNAFQRIPVKNSNGQIVSGFIAELNPQGTAVLAATYLQGIVPSTNGFTTIRGLALDSSTNVFVGGFTGTNGIPLQDPFTASSEPGGQQSADMVYAELSPDLSTLKLGGFLNSTDPSFAGTSFSGLTVDSENHLIVVGAPGADFPITAGAYQTQPVPSPYPFQSNGHTFVAKMDMGVPAPSVCLNLWHVQFDPTPVSNSRQKMLTLTNCGNATLQVASLVSSLSAFTATHNCSSVAPGNTCSITITFSPVDNSNLLGPITIKDNAAVPSVDFWVSGQGLVLPISITAANGGSLSATISGGGTATYNLQVVGAPGFSGNVALSCSRAAAIANCSANPTAVVIVSGSTAGFTITVNTDNSATARIVRTPVSLAGLGFSLLLVAPYLFFAQKNYSCRGLFLAIAFFSIGMSGCGNGSTGSAGQSPSTPTRTPPGTYTLTVTAETSSITLSQNLTLIVQ